MVMSDRIALLRAGELEQVATPREIYSRPATSYAAQFIGHTNLLRADVRDGVVHCGSLFWTSQLPDGSALLFLRPENIEVAAPSDVPGKVRRRGKLVHKAFEDAGELLQNGCTER